MAGNQYLSNSKNPFFSIEDDDVDDETFLRNSRVRNEQSSYANQETDYLEQRRQELLDKRRIIEERTLQSSEMSLALLLESKQIGVATAEELLVQREQLERTDKKLDDINATLKFSQKHIQGIKSVFGSLKNYLSGKSGEPAPTKEDGKDVPPSNGMTSSSSPLTGIVESTRASPGMSATDSHPAMRIRGLNEAPSHSSHQTNDFQTLIDQRLDMMCDELVGLKGIGEGIGTELAVQDSIIERITDKTEKADFTIGKQNKDMKRILKK